MEYEEGQIAEDGAGNFLVFKYGAWHPSNEDGVPRAPIDASAVWGPGARELPNGTVERVGPRGGVTVIANNASSTEGGVGKLTEAQGKAMLYGGMMRGAERDYQQARQEGYNPGSLRNQIAGVAGVIPFDGDFFGRLIRDDVSDRGRQAELRWAEGNLRQLTGAAATNPEIARVAAINFDRGNDELSGQRYRTRAETYQGTRFAAGPGASQLGDYPDMGGSVGEVGDNGLPTYPGVQDAVAGIVDSAPEGPRPGDVVVTQQPLAPEDTPNSLSARGYVYDPERDIWTRSTQVELPEGRAGGSLPPASPGEVASERRQDRGLVRRIEAAGLGAIDALTFGLSDEIGGALDAIAPSYEGTISGFENGFGNAYRHNRDLHRANARADMEDVPVSRGAGQVAGALAFLPRAMAQGAARAAVPLGRRVLQGTGQGAAYGGAYGFGSGEGTAVERAPNALQGAVIGAPVGAASPIVANALGRTVVEPAARAVFGGGRFAARQIGRAGSALGVPGSGRLVEAAAPNALRSGLNRFADRMGPNRVNALQPELARQADLGMDATLIDIADDASVGRVRALGSRDIEARDELVRFTEGRRARLPSRVRRIAQEEISPDQRPTPEVIDDLARTRRTNADMIQGFGRDPVRLDENTAQALQGPVARQALRDAAARAASSLDPEERAAAPLLDALANGRASAVELTVRDVQDISAALRKSADSAFRNSPADGPVLSGLGNAIRQAGRNQSDGYAAWLRQYADDSSLLEAATTGRNFVSVSPDPVSARSTQAVVRNAENATPAELAVQRQASGQAAQAAASNPKGARGVLDNMAFDVDQLARARAIGVDADRLQQRSQAELRNLTQAQRASPRIGSESSLNLQDAGDAAGLMGAFRRPVSAAAGAVMNRIRARGFNNDEADAIIRAAIDPKRTQEVIDILSQRMSRREARGLARVIRRQVTIGLQSGQQQ